MASLIHTQMLQCYKICPLLLWSKSGVHAPGLAVGRSFNHQLPQGPTRLRRYRSQATDHTEQTSSSDKTSSSSSSTATTTTTSATTTAAHSDTNRTSSNENAPASPAPQESDGDNESLSPLELATATSFIEKLAGALVMYGLAMLLSGLSGVDSTAGLQWNGGAPLTVGATAAVPVILVAALLFLPTLDLGFSQRELAAVGEADQELEGEVSVSVGFSLGREDDEARPPMTSKAVKQGLWLYQMSVLKPWYPAFEWSSVGMLYLASCTASGAQELLVRGYGGSILQGWYNGLLAGTTDVNNPIYWAKVFKLVTPDTARWLAAFSLIALQVALSSSSATRAAAFANAALNRSGRAAAQPGVRGVMVQNVTVTLEPGGEVARALLLDKLKEGGGGGGGARQGAVTVAGQEQEEKKAKEEGAGGGSKVEESMVLELPTAEERVVYGAYLAMSALLCGVTNLAWAASGSLLGSFTAQVVIDGAVTALQQYKATRLPEKELWEAVRKQEEEEEAKGGGSDADKGSGTRT